MTANTLLDILCWYWNEEMDKVRFRIRLPVVPPKGSSIYGEDGREYLVHNVFFRPNPPELSEQGELVATHRVELALTHVSG
jgi:hypothetical protein